MPRIPWNSYPAFPPGAKGFEFKPAQTWYPKSSEGVKSQSRYHKQYRFARHPNTLTDAMLGHAVSYDKTTNVWLPPELDPHGPLAKRQIVRVKSAPVVAQCCPAFLDQQRQNLMADSSGPPRPDSKATWRPLPKDRSLPVRPGEPCPTLFPHYQHLQFKDPQTHQRMQDDAKIREMNAKDDRLKNQECGGDALRLTQPLTYTARMKAKTFERATANLMATCDGYAAWSRGVAAADSRNH